MAAPREPIVWVLQGSKTGDNAQARELARLLGYSTVLKSLAYNALHHRPNLLVGASIAHLRREEKCQLSPPWPSLVICAGKRAVPVALWIKKQSGGRTKIVQLGRPRVPLNWIDLVVTTPQYGLPPLANVIERPMPFAPSSALDEAALRNWRSRFGNLPRPWTGVLVGGRSYPLYFDENAVLSLAAQVRQAQGQGAVLVSMSPRTGDKHARKLAAAIPPPAYIHIYGESGNPHQAILALADRFIVTSDSMSMLAEVTGTGKPYEVFELPRARLALSWPAQNGLGGWLARHGLISPPRDLRKVPRSFCATNDQEIFWRIKKLMHEG